MCSLDRCQEESVCLNTMGLANFEKLLDLKLLLISTHMDCLPHDITLISELPHSSSFWALWDLQWLSVFKLWSILHVDPIPGPSKWVSWDWSILCSIRLAGFICFYVCSSYFYIFSKLLIESHQQGCWSISGHRYLASHFIHWSSYNWNEAWSESAAFSLVPRWEFNNLMTNVFRLKQSIFVH